MMQNDGLIYIKDSPIHGKGGFARIPIAAGERVVEYVGRKIDKQESLRQCEAGNPCIFYLDEQHNLDGNVAENPARFLNHSCRPNSEARAMDGGIWIVAVRDIAADEEVTFNYSYDLEDYREHPCRCGAPECAGYIVAEEFFGKGSSLNRLPIEIYKGLSGIAMSLARAQVFQVREFEKAGLFGEFCPIAFQARDPVLGGWMVAEGDCAVEVFVFKFLQFRQGIDEPVRIDVGGDEIFPAFGVGLAFVAAREALAHHKLGGLSERSHGAARVVEYGF